MPELSINVNVSLAPETLEILKSFLGSSPAAPAKTDTAKPRAGKPAAPVAAEQPAAEEPKEAVPAEEKAEEGKLYTVEEVRAEVQAKAQAGKREEVKALLTKFGAASVTVLDAKHYSAFMSELANLK